MNKQVVFYGWLMIWTIVAFYILFVFTGIGDAGDGLLHYMYARYGHKHTLNFLDPWAKTGFTLFAWPFAQLGLKGMMFMNILSAGICLWLVNQISQMLGIKQSWASYLILSLSTFYFILMYSGLTEHVFSLMLTLSIFLLLKNKWAWASIILSTLPFFRQEGYIIIASLLPFYLYRYKLRYIPLLSVSFIVVGIIGGIVYSDIGWIIHSNPYIGKAGYGSGPWKTFFVHLYYSMGLLNFIWFGMGILCLSYFLIKKRTESVAAIFLVVALPFLAFFFAHAIFWRFGIFHSMGLQRVLNCVIPLGAIIAGYGFSSVIDLFSTRFKKIVIVVITLPLIAYPLIPSPSSITNHPSFSISTFENMSRTTCVQYKNSGKYVYYQHPMVPYYLDMDPFNIDQCHQLSNVDLNKLKPGALVFWDDRLTSLETGIKEKTMLSNPRLNKMYESNDGKFKWMVFEVKK